MTKVDPPTPIKNLKIVNPVAEFTKPVRPVGMAEQTRIMAMRIRGPNLSTNGPRRKRMIIVATPADMEDDQICSFVRSNVFWTSDRSGVIANL
jgi:hypothetical protein